MAIFQELRSELLSFEYVLLLMGIGIFILFIILFTVQTLRKEQTKNTIYLLIGVVVMVAFPVIKKIQISGDMIVLETYDKKLASGEPIPLEEQAKLGNAVEKLGESNRYFKPSDRYLIAKASTEVGKLDIAKEQLVKIKHPDFTQEKNLLQKTIATKDRTQARATDTKFEHQDSISQK